MNRSLTLLLVASVLLAAGNASGADIDPILMTAPELAPIEAATGWYVRGDVSYGFDGDISARQTFRAPSFGVSDGYDGLSFDDGVGIGAGLGYQATDWFRLDATVAYWSQDLDGHNGFSAFFGFDGRCGSRDSADADAIELMANAYVDLGTIAGITPYLGGGLGAVHVDYGDVSASGFCQTGFLCDPSALASANYQGESSWRFAYALAGGVSYDVSQSLALDVGYRYLNVDGGDMYRSNADPAGLTIAGEDEGFDRHTIRAGLRFKLW